MKLNVKLYLDVPKEEEEQCLALGGKWDLSVAKWYVPEDKDIEKFNRWTSKDGLKSVFGVLQPKEKDSKESEPSKSNDGLVTEETTENINIHDDVRPEVVTVAKALGNALEFKQKQLETLTQENTKLNNILKEKNFKLEVKQKQLETLTQENTKLNNILKEKNFEVEVKQKQLETLKRDIKNIKNEMHNEKVSTHHNADSALTTENHSTNIDGSYNGFETQFHNKNKSKTTQLVIGLDFGTAFTKIIVGRGKTVKFAIPFEKNEYSENPYILPCRFFITSNGVCRLNNVNGQTKTTEIKDLKMAILFDSLTDVKKIEIIIFLALTFRHTRQYILNTKFDIFKDEYLDWVINVGLPAEKWENPYINKIYKEIVVSAWNISVQSGPINRDTIKVFDELEDSIHPDKIQLFPEFVAQVMGYIASPLRQPDLHILIDIGAGTVDTVIFNVHKDKHGGPVLPIFVRSVQIAGTEILVNKRTKKDKYMLNLFNDIPDNGKFCQLLKITLDELNEVDKPLSDLLRKKLSENFEYAEKKHPKSKRWTKNNRGSSKWWKRIRTIRRKDPGIPLFFCGGGSNCEFYTNVFDVLFGESYKQHCKIVKKDLPIGSSLDAPKLNKSDYHRLSVAYGLSFEPLDFARIKIPDEIEDREPPMPPDRPSHEDLYE